MTETGMHIRRITSYDDLKGIEALQTAVWQFEPMAVTPRHVFIAAIRSGGLVLGAFDEQDTFIGFALAFQGERNNRPCLYSHLVGILPSMQSQGVGYDLKMQQRKYGLELGFESIIWTFDPMLAKNARLNIGKLGGKVYSFLPNAYGSSAFKLYGRGFPTHRFELCWHLKQTNAPDEPSGINGISVIDTTNIEHPKVLSDLLYNPNGQTLKLPIPAHHLAMRVNEPYLAHSWQESACHCADVLLKHGYSIQDFRSTDTYGEYILRPHPKA